MSPSKERESVSRFVSIYDLKQSLTIKNEIYRKQQGNIAEKRPKCCRYIQRTTGNLALKSIVSYAENNSLNKNIELGSPALQADSLPTELSGKPQNINVYNAKVHHSNNVHPFGLSVLVDKDCLH